MKKVNLVTALFLVNLCLAAGVYAQGDNSMMGHKDMQQIWGDAKTRQAYAKDIAKRMQEKIGLTDEQAAKVAQIWDTFFAGTYNAMHNMNSEVATEAQGGQKVQENADQYNASLAQILTPEQMVKWQELQRPKVKAAPAQVIPSYEKRDSSNSSGYQVVK